MNSREPFQEIGDLLRSRKPDPRPLPGLENRIMRALPERKSRPAWPWFVLPPAVAMAAVLLGPDTANERERENTGSTGLIPTEAPQSPAGFIPPANPLEREKLALQRDATRAGRFLIDCLPSFGESE